MGKKCGSQKLGMAIHSFYIQIQPINLISTLNWEVWPRVKLSTSLAWTRPFKEPYRA